MNKLFLLLLMFIPSIVFGTTFDDEWPIYVYGDAQYYKLIYDGIAMIVQDRNFMDVILNFIFAFSALFAAMGFVKSDLPKGLWHTAAGLGVVTMIMYPTSTVHILDVRTLHGFVYPSTQSTGTYTGYSKVDHLPFFLAIVPSIATSIKYHIIDITTDAITPISGGSLRDSGFATPMTLADDMIGLASFKYSKDDQYVAPNFELSLSHYIEYCIIKEVLYIDKRKTFGIMNPKGNQLDALNPANFSGLATTEIPNINGSDDGTTCGSFWNSEIAAKTTIVGNTLFTNIQDKNPKIDVSAMANAMSGVAGLEANASVASTQITNAMLNIATTGTLLNTFEKAGAGLTGIDLSNSVAAKQSLFANMTDSTGQFKWMIRVIPVLEFLIFGILIYLGLMMGMVAGMSGAEKGGKMIFNYATGLVAFSFIDVALAIVQAVSLYYYNMKMADAMIMLGQNPFTATNIPLYMQEMGYMSGMMGLAAVIVVPLVVTVVFKGETAAAMGAYNSVMGKYKGDGGGQNLSNSLSNSAAVHAAEAAEHEEYARRQLAGYGMTPPAGALASQMWERVSAEAESYGLNMGARRAGNEQFGGSLGNFAQERAESGIGSGMQKITASINAGQGLLESINRDPSSLSNFGHQARTDAMTGFEAQARKGELAQSNPLLSRDNQIEAAQGNAESDLRKSVATGLGASKAFSDGAGDDFSYQVQTDSEAGIKGQAKQGELSKVNPLLSRDNQVLAAEGNAEVDIRKKVGAGLGASKAFSDGAGDDFSYQVQTDSEAGIKGQAKQGELSKVNPLLSRDNQVLAAEGNAEVDIRKKVGAGLGASKAFSDGAGDDFSYQVQTDSEAGIKGQAAKGKFSKDNAEFDREAQVNAAMIMANDGLVKGVQNAMGMVGSMGFDKQGNIDNQSQFDKYASGLEIQSRIAANKVMGAGIWAEGKDKQETIDAMSDIQRVGAMGVAGEVAKGDAFQKSKYGGNLDRFESDTTDIEKSKSDSMFGQAEGVRKNYKANPDMYSQNAEYSEESRQQSTDRKIQTQGGIAGAVAIDIADSAMKAASQMLNVEANKKAGFIDDSGNVTDRGMRAFAISPTEMAAQLGVKESVLFGDDAGKNVVEQLRTTGIKAGKSEKDINAALHAVGLTDENGENAASGLDLVGALAKMGAMNYSSSKALSFMGMTMSANIDGQGSAKVVKADGGNAVSMTDSMESGKKETFNNDVKQLNNTDPLTNLAMNRFGGDMQKAANWAKSAEGAKWAMDPRNELSMVAAEAGHQISDKTGMSAETAALLVTGVAGGAASLMAINKMSKEPIKLNSKQLYKLTPIFDDDDNIKGYEDSKGNKAADKEGYATDKHGKRVESGAVGRAWDSAGSALNNAGNKLRESFSSQSLDKSDNTVSDKSSDKNNNSSSQHDNSPNSDTHNISNNTKSVKDLGAEIDTQFKKEQVLGGDANYNKDMDALKDRQASEKALNPNNTNVDSRHNMEKAAMEDAHYQRINEANLGAPTEKGFFGKRMEALGEAMHSGAGWKAKAGMMLGAVALGEASETAGNIMQLLDPTSFITGTEMSKDADLNFSKMKSGVAPQHQGAFSQSSGFNSSMAIQQDQIAQSSMISANNLQTIASASLTQGRVGGFFNMQDANGENVAFSVNKTRSDYPMMINGQDTGVPHQQFQSMMQNGEMAAQFANAISGSDFTNKDVYNTTNNLLQDMSMQNKMADRKQMIHNNASDTHASMQHKEMLEEVGGRNKDEEFR
ncbi:MAG: conjugal transfer protein TraG N-terminal domain-containing protein [Sulfurimonas sp.]